MLCYQVSLYCGRQLSFLSRPWVVCIIGYREQGRDLVFIMYATTPTNTYTTYPFFDFHGPAKFAQKDHFFCVVRTLICLSCSIQSECVCGGGGVGGSVPLANTRSSSEPLGAARSRSEPLGAARRCSELLGAARNCSELLGAARSCSEVLGPCQALGALRKSHPCGLTYI